MKGDDLPLSELGQYQLARMVLAGWCFKRAAGTDRGWECDVPHAVFVSLRLYNRRYLGWTLNVLVNQQWGIYQRWMHQTP